MEPSNQIREENLIWAGLGGKENSRFCSPPFLFHAPMHLHTSERKLRAKPETFSQQKFLCYHQNPKPCRSLRDAAGEEGVTQGTGAQEGVTGGDRGLRRV